MLDWKSWFPDAPPGWLGEVERDGGLECAACGTWRELAGLQEPSCPDCGARHGSAMGALPPSRWTGPLAGREARFEIVHAAPARGGLEEATAKDLDLERPVRLVLGRSPLTAAELFARATEASRLDHPGILPIHRALRLPDGSSLAVLHDPGPAASPAAAARALIEDPRRLVTLAHAIGFAASRGLDPGPLDLERLVVAQGETRLAGWERPPVGSDGAPHVVRLGRFLLKLLAASTMEATEPPRRATGSTPRVGSGTTSRRIRRGGRRDTTSSLRRRSASGEWSRLEARSRPPRLLRSIARASLRGRYRDLAEMIDDLERYAVGDPVRAAIGSPGRAIRRVVRRRPVLSSITGALLACLVVGAAVLGADRNAARGRRREAASTDALASLERTRSALASLDPLLEEAERARTDRTGALERRQAAWHAEANLRTSAEEARLAGALQEAGQRRSTRLVLARVHLDRIAGEAAMLDGRSREGGPDALSPEAARAVAEVRAAGALARRRAAILELEEIEHDFARADLDEETKLSTRTLDDLVGMADAHAALEGWASGPLVELPDATRDTPWEVPAVRLHALLSEHGALLSADADARARTDALVERLSPRGRVEIPEIPRSSFEISRVETGPVHRLGDPRPIEPGTLDLSPGYWLLEVERDGARWRFPLLVRPGVTARPDLALPEAAPAGFVWVPPTAWFRGGAEGYNATRYRRDRLRRGFFIARTETTFAEYREYLLDRRASGSLTAEELPVPRRDLGSAFDGRLDWAPNYRRAPERLGVGWDHPVRGIRLSDMHAYAHWLTGRSGRRWRYHVPDEAEWELAARGPAGALLPWGDAFQPDRANVGGNPGHSTFGPVGDPPADASIYGAFGMAGNARERTATLFGTAEEGLFVVKGGYANALEIFVYASSRHCHGDADRMPQDGFRLAAIPWGEE